jgi:hypothetical protein
MDELHNYMSIPREISNIPRNIAGNVYDSWHYWNNIRVLPYHLPLFFFWSKRFDGWEILRICKLILGVSARK